MRIYVNATSVAVACNLNRWQHPAKALDTVFRSHRFGDTRKHAMKRARRTGGESAMTSIARHEADGYQHVMNSHKSEPLPSTEKLRDAADVCRTIREGKQHIARAIVAVEAASATKVAETPCAEVQRTILDTTKQEVAALRRGNLEFESKVARDYGTQQEAATIQKLSKKRKQYVQAENEEVLYLVMGRVDPATGRVHVKEEVAKVREEMGEEGKKTTTTPLPLATEEVADLSSRRDPLSWGIGGKLDATIGATIVETKTRKSRLFFEVPVYERVQLECYMRMKGQQQCLLVERFEETLNEIEVDRDDAFWTHQVVPPLTRFVAVVEWFTQFTQHAQQDRWMGASDIEKEKLYDTWLESLASNDDAEKVGKCENA